MALPASCFSIISGAFPNFPLRVNLVHTAFETAAAIATGLKAGLEVTGRPDVTVVAWAGDGGTFDIGLQALSGAAERNEDILYVCYDNEAYMNTGNQRSSATPLYAWTTTTPTGEAGEKKDILAHHGGPQDPLRRLGLHRLSRGPQDKGQAGDDVSGHEIYPHPVELSHGLADDPGHDDRRGQARGHDAAPSRCSRSRAARRTVVTHRPAEKVPGRRIPEDTGAVSGADRRNDPRRPRRPSTSGGGGLRPRPTRCARSRRPCREIGEEQGTIDQSQLSEYDEVSL